MKKTFLSIVIAMLIAVVFTLSGCATQHKIVFMANGVKVGELRCDTNGSVTPLAMEDTEEFVFNGWFDEKGNAFDGNTIITSDMVITAKLTDISNGIAFEAYGPVHGAGYVGKATLIIKGEEIISGSIDEACFPTYITAGDGVSVDDKVTVTVTSHGKEVEQTYYKTVKFAGVTASFDADKKSYVVDGKTFIEWLQDEANSKKYFDAVEKNDVAVIIGGKEDKAVLCASSLLKSQNGYGGTNFDWKGNAQKTVDYVIANGFDGAASFTKNDGVWVDTNGVVTGATWTDMATTKENSNSYIALLKKAFDKAAK